MNTQTSLKNSVDEKLNDLTVTEAVSQLKEATSSIYDAMGSIKDATAAKAKVHLSDGQVRAMELEEKAEEVVKAKPLATIGIAFAAGWLVSQLLQRRH
jgi:ElaB/YqjD/DUF883 family membrane-anchored ribosome-binding protein